MKHLSFCVVLLLTMTLCMPGAWAQEGGDPAPSEAPRYVFLFIGDGMGSAQVDLADQVNQAITGESLRMVRLPVQGQTQTRSANSAVTDSAAAGTALAAGVKTNNGMIGQTPDGELAPSIAEQFVRAGRAVGVLSSVQVNHATPAAFYAHERSRQNYTQIARQFGPSGIDLLVGRSLNSQDGQKSDIIDAWKSAGIAVVDSIADAAEAPADAQMVVLDESLADPEAAHGQLSEAVALAIARLDGPAGFFIAIEGGAIDWRGHSNEAWENAQETMAFDRAIEVAYQFYEQHPDQTLIVVTADHETGGMSLTQPRIDVNALRSAPDRRSTLSGRLPKVIEQEVVEAMGLDALTEDERQILAEAINRKARGPVVSAARQIADARAGVQWSTGRHTATDVPVMAVGVGAQRFSGSMDNTEIPRRIREIALPAAAAASPQER